MIQQKGTLMFLEISSEKNKGELKNPNINNARTKIINFFLEAATPTFEVRKKQYTHEKAAL